MTGPLSGVTVLVTRPERQAESMVALLNAAGAEAVRFPLLRIEDAADGGAALRRAVSRLDEFDWIVLSSANGAERLLAATREVGSDGALRSARLACVGPATAGVLRGVGFEPAIVADRHVAEGLLDALTKAGLSGARVLLPQAAGARAVLRRGLEGCGAVVEAVEAYRSAPEEKAVGNVRERLEQGQIEAVTFTSPSAVQRFAAVVGTDVGGATVAVIGPVTAQAAVAAGLRPQVIAKAHTIPGLIEALADHYNNTDRTKQP